MKVTFSAHERLAIFQLLEQTPWGGTEEELLVRDAAYEALELSAFEKLDPKATPPAWATAETQKGIEVSAEIGAFLCRALVVSGQNRMLGRISARVIRRLRAALPAPKPPKEQP